MIICRVKGEYYVFLARLGLSMSSSMKSIGKNFCTDIHVSQRMCPSNFGNPLTFTPAINFPLAPLSSQNFSISFISVSNLIPAGLVSAFLTQFLVIEKAVKVTGRRTCVTLKFARKTIQTTNII